MTRLQALEDRLRQRDLAPQRRVHGVVEQVVVQEAVRTDCVEQGLAINQDAVMRGGYIAVRLLEAAVSPREAPTSVPSRRALRKRLIMRPPSPVAGPRAANRLALTELGAKRALHELATAVEIGLDPTPQHKHDLILALRSA